MFPIDDLIIHTILALLLLRNSKSFSDIIYIGDYPHNNEEIDDLSREHVNIHFVIF